jgi:hypothetical protein
MYATRNLFLGAALAAATLCAACGQAQAPTQDMAKIQNPLVGSWTSQGADVAPLLAGMPFNFTRIDATFAESTYEVSATDKNSQTVKFTGTWTATAAATAGFYDITLNQAAPTTVVSKGIYKIDATVTPNRMSYEVLQVMPDLKLTPPTASAGFGSTNGGTLGMTNVQKYSKVN